jgi:peptide/nickel transport system substrate-binding protein
LLTAAGFSKENPVKLQIWYPASSPIRSLAAQILKAYAEKYMDGMLQFEVNTVDGATFYGGIAKSFYPTALLDWYPDFLDADNYIQPFLGCDKGSDAKGCEEGGSQTQGSFYYSETMNKLIEDQRKEQNPQVRNQIFANIQAQIATDVPYVPLWQNKDYVFARKGVSGVQLNPTQNLIYKTIKK